MTTKYHGFKKITFLGSLTSITFILGAFILGSRLVDYNPISQDKSAIGEKGSNLISFRE